MKHAITLLLALVCAASAQTYKTVTADTNNAIRTNFTITAAKVSGTVAMASNVTGVVAITNGGTGASTATNALAALLPSYASNSGKVLTVNFGETGVEWSTNSGGGGGVTGVDVSGGSTGLTFSGGPISNSGTITMNGILAVSNGGTGATNYVGALTNLKVLKNSDTVALIGTNAGSRSVVIGYTASASSGNSVSIGNGAFVGDTYGIAIGNGVSVSGKGATVGANGWATDGGSVGYAAKATDGGAIGSSAYTENGAAIGKWAYSYDGAAIGYDANATATASVQIMTGTNSTENTIQFLSAGTVSTNEWARIAALSTYPTTNISVTGTNNTNTLVFSNGILVEVQ